MTGQSSLEQFGYTTPTLSPAYEIIDPRQGGRSWEPYKIQPIRVTGTIKSVKTDPSLPWGRREIRKGISYRACNSETGRLRFSRSPSFFLHRVEKNQQDPYAPSIVSGSDFA